MANTRIPHETRPRNYAAIVLLLDLMHIAREATGLDHESIVIACAVNEATMRPILFGRNPDPEAIDLAVVPEDLRGGISRLAVAEITQLPRETVRRKINQMIAAGVLFEDEDGLVRAAARMADPLWQKAGNDSFAAVQKFDRRLRTLGCKGISDS